MSSVLTDLMQNKQLQVGVIGAGTMGRGIAQVSAMAGFTTTVCDINENSIRDAKASLEKILSRLVEKEKITEAAKNETLQRLKFTTDLGDLKSCNLAIEAIVENLEVKAELFQKLDAIVDSQSLLATNTSSLSVTALAAKTKVPERVVGLHFFNPVPLMKVVEVIASPLCKAETIDFLKGWVKTIGHKPVVAKDSPGFIVNHAGRGFGTEAFKILEENIAEAETIDQVLKGTGEFPMGPFQLADLVGLDISLKVMESMFAQYYSEPRYRPPALVKTRVAAGLLGRKTSQGFYKYENGKPVATEVDTSSAATLNQSLWIDPENSIGAERIKSFLPSSVKIEEGESPSSNALCLVAPLGADATTTAKRKGLDPKRTIAIDTLFENPKALTIMGTPLVPSESLQALQTAMTTEERKAFVIQDSPGFVAQRVVACIVNVGCEIAQQEITTPEELNQAVQTGLGYKNGPLGLGDKYGANNISTILNELYDFYKDPRYRPCPWLTRRTQLEMPLTQTSMNRQ